jgi:hypothetical protein
MNIDSNFYLNFFNPNSEKINEPTYILAQQKRLKDANEGLQNFLENYMDDIEEVMR